MRDRRSRDTAVEEEPHAAGARASRSTYSPSQDLPRAATVDLRCHHHLLSPVGEFSVSPSPPRHGCAAQIRSPELRAVCAVDPRSNGRVPVRLVKTR